MQHGERVRAVARLARQCGAAGDDRPGVGGGAGEQRRERLGTELADHRLEELSHDAIGEVALERAAARLQHPHAAAARQAADTPQQRRLADPARALDEQHAAVALADPRHRHLQQRQLRVPFQQIRGRHRVR